MSDNPKASRRWYLKHRVEHLARMAARRRENKARFYALVDRIKSGPCVDCGGKFPACAMDFDHRRGKKVANVSEMRMTTVEAVLAEIAKCDLVCSNCHRIRTHQCSDGRKHKTPVS